MEISDRPNISQPSPDEENDFPKKHLRQSRGTSKVVAEKSPSPNKSIDSIVFFSLLDELDCEAGLLSAEILGLPPLSLATWCPGKDLIFKLLVEVIWGKT